MIPPAAQADPGDPERVTEAADWVARNVVAGGFGKSWDSAQLGAFDRQQLMQAVRWLGLSPENQAVAEAVLDKAADPTRFEWMVGMSLFGDPEPGTRSAYPLGQLALGVAAAGQDPRRWGGKNLVTELRGLIGGPADGIWEGKFIDDNGGVPLQTNSLEAQTSPILVLATAGILEPTTVDYLLKLQCDDGGFSASSAVDAVYMPLPACQNNPASGGSTAVATGMALQTLIAVQQLGAEGLETPIAAATAWLLDNQNPDGTFQAYMGDGSPTAPTTRADELSWAVAGLLAVGETEAAALTQDRLRAQQWRAADVEGTPQEERGGAFHDGAPLNYNAWPALVATPPAMAAIAGRTHLDIETLPNHPPTVSGTQVTVAPGGSVQVRVQGSDPDGDKITWQTSTPRHGVVTGTAPNLTYTPRAGVAETTDSFTLTVSDERGATATATATVTITKAPAQTTPQTKIKTKIGKAKAKVKKKAVVLKVRVKAAGNAKVKGKVRIVVKKGKKTIIKRDARLNKNGVAKLKLTNKRINKALKHKTIKGTYRVNTRYLGNNTHQTTKPTKTQFKIKRRR